MNKHFLNKCLSTHGFHFLIDFASLNSDELTAQFVCQKANFAKVFPVLHTSFDWPSFQGHERRSALFSRRKE